MMTHHLNASGHRDTRSDVHLVQLTDTHIYNDRDGVLAGVNTWQSLQRVVNALCRDENHAHAFIATGDLTHEGDERAYRLLLQALAPLPAPLFWLAGNHDHLAPMASTATAATLHARQILLPHWQVILLDSHEENEVNGVLAQAELDFLQHCLQQQPDKYALIFLHHHILPVNCAWLDNQRIVNAGQLLAILDAHPQVRLVCNGHVHQEWQQQRGHYLLASTPSTCMQFKTNSDDYAEEALPPGYRRFILQADGRYQTDVVRCT